ncbi:MAG: corrinoid protein [Anaerolineae bacterium]|nr:corrinoid protein [Anaerolineae bacterium]
MVQDELFIRMTEAVIDGEKERAVTLAQEALHLEIPPLEAINKGYIVGIQKVGELFEKGDFFLPELVMGAEAMQAALAVLEPELKRRHQKRERLGSAIAGTVEGDIHQIGKRLVCTMLVANGFDVLDLGPDVAAETFIEKVRELQPDLLLLSALMTTTMPEQKSVIEALKGGGLRDRVKVMVGGAAVSPSWAEEIGADGYAENAIEAVEVAKRLVKSS